MKRALCLVLILLLLVSLVPAQAAREKLQLTENFSITLPKDFSATRNDEMSAYYGGEAYTLQSSDDVSVLLIVFPADGISEGSLESALLIFQESEWGEFMPEFVYEACQIHKHPAVRAASEEDGNIYNEYFILVNDIIVYAAAACSSEKELLLIQSVLDVI